MTWAQLYQCLQSTSTSQIPFLATCRSLEPAPALLHHFCQVTFHPFWENALQAGAAERQDSQKRTSHDNHEFRNTPHFTVMSFVQHFWKSSISSGLKCLLNINGRTKLRGKKRRSQIYLWLSRCGDWTEPASLYMREWVRPDARTSEWVNTSSSVNRRVRKWGGRHSAGEL